MKYKRNNSDLEVQGTMCSLTQASMANDQMTPTKASLNAKKKKKKPRKQESNQPISNNKNEKQKHTNKKQLGETENKGSMTQNGDREEATAQHSTYVLYVGSRCSLSSFALLI